jgi:hypothetical protein
VTVGGQPVKVVNGSYNVPMHMTAPTETITVAGQASGYTPGSTTTTVQYSAAMASAIAAAETTLSSGPQPTNTNPAGVSSNAAAAKPSAKPATHSVAAVVTAAKVAKPAASHSIRHTTTRHETTSHRTRHHATTSHRASKHATTSHRTSRHATARHRTRHHRSARKHRSSTHTTARSTQPSGVSSSAGRQPEHRSVLTVRHIKRLWIAGCVKAGAGASYKPYCRCTYAHLSKAGALKSRKRLRELMRKLRPYERTHDIAKLPAFVRRAIVACAGKLPPLEPMVSDPSVSKLPGTTYPSTPVSTPTSPSGSTTPTPTSTAPTQTGTTPTGTTTPTPTGTSPTPTGTAPTGTTPGSTTNGTTAQSTGGTPPPWASLMRELDRVVAAVAAHHP